MVAPPQKCFKPDMKNHQIYSYYLKLYDYFRMDENLLMRSIKKIKRDVIRESK